MTNLYTIKTDAPIKASDYCRLRSLAGLSSRSLASAEIALPRSLFSVSIFSQDNKLIGMGRVVGDLGSFVQVVDIAVDPTHQGKGLGRSVMKKIMDYIHSEVPKEAFVSLFADVEFLYDKYGFKAPILSKGMVLERI